jgi:hypothetical protein
LRVCVCPTHIPSRCVALMKDSFNELGDLLESRTLFILFNTNLYTARTFSVLGTPSRVCRADLDGALRVQPRRPQNIYEWKRLTRAWTHSGRFSHSVASTVESTVDLSPSRPTITMLSLTRCALQMCDRDRVGVWTEGELDGLFVWVVSSPGFNRNGTIICQGHAFPNT